MVVPHNYILLGIVTLGMACFIASFAASFTELSVITAIMGCCLSTAGLFIAALFTSTSTSMVRNLSTGLATAMLMDLAVLLMMLFTMSFHDKALVFAASLALCAMSGIFIIFDLHYVIIPGVADHNDYILAALNLYLDIARLFWYLLILLGDGRS